MRSRIYQITIEEDPIAPSLVARVVKYTINERVPPLADGQQDALDVLYIEYVEDKFDEESNPAGTYRVMCVPEEGTPIAQKHMGIMYEFAVSEVICVSHLVPMQDIQVAWEEYQKTLEAEGDEYVSQEGKANEAPANPAAIDE